MILVELFWVFFLIGAFTFGGGYAMVAMVQQQVSARGWMDAESVIDFVAIAESTPGPIAVNLATFVGARMGGVWGAVCATVGVVLPSFAVILAVARCYQAFRQNRLVQGVMSGLKPAVAGLIASAVMTIMVTIFAPDGAVCSAMAAPASWFWLVATGVVYWISVKWKKLHPIVLILICAGIGILAGFSGIQP